MSIYRWNMECYIESHCLRLFKTSRENEHQNLSSKNSAKQKSDQILFKKWARWFKVKFSHPLFGGHKQPSKGWPVYHSKKVQNCQAESSFPLFTQKPLFLWATSPCCLQKQELHGLFKEKEMLGVINFYPPWKINMTMEMHLISRCMYPIEKWANIPWYSMLFFWRGNLWLFLSFGSQRP